MSCRTMCMMDDMPVSLWFSPDITERPLDTANVVSSEIWKKFGLDTPEIVCDTWGYREDWMPDSLVAYDTWKMLTGEKPEMLLEMVLDKGADETLRRVRLAFLSRWYTQFTGFNPYNPYNHDCMWAGLCISNAHDKTLRALHDNCSQIQKTVTAGQSLLISHHVSRRPTEKLDSDGDSSRPETPLGSESYYAISEDEYRTYLDLEEGESISDCMVDIMRLVPVGQVTGQMRRCRAEDQVQSEVHRETNIRNTLSDHSYYQPTGRELESLGLQTPSETEEEEIDVVTYERPVQQDAADHRHQLILNAAIKKEKPPGTKPRGRPKKNPEDPQKKKTGKTQAKKQQRYEPYTTTKNVRSGQSSKRSTSTTTRRCASSTSSASFNSATSRSSSSDEDIDEGKRTQHNNSERTRRIELKESFTELRLLVPAVMHNEKAAKVAILRRAAEYCDTLVQQEESNQQTVNSLKRVQEMLRTRLGYLRRNLAMSR